jgi:hypothetical protein
MHVTATADTRYTFTGQFLEASAIFVRRTRAIEAMPDPVDDVIRSEHRGLIAAVIIQCAAALETQANEVCVYGPGAHLGSNGTDRNAQQFLYPLAGLIDDAQAPERFNLILHLLGKSTLGTGAQPFQDAALVVRLRNEIVHYKSHWGEEMKSAKLFGALKALKHQPPPWFTHPSVNFFPHRCLSADCGAWALKSTVAFLNAFYAALGIQSPLLPYGSRLEL